MDYELVEITWIDACLDEGHLPPTSDVKPLERVNVGYLLEEDKTHLAITWGFIKNINKGETACDMKMSLPTPMIISRDKVVNIKKLEKED